MDDALTLQRTVGQLLRSRLTSVLDEPRAFGEQADFLAKTPDGRTVVVEVKRGVANAQRVQQAAFQLARGVDRFGAEVGVLVFEYLPAGVFLSGQIAGPDVDLHLTDVSHLELVLQLLTEESPPSLHATRSGRSMLVVLPPGGLAQAVVNQIAFASASFPNLELLTTLDTVNVWRSRGARSVVREAHVVVVDLTGEDPGVMFVLGYALGLNGQVIGIVEHSSATAVAGLRILQYNFGDISDLRRQMQAELVRMLGDSGSGH